MTSFERRLAKEYANCDCAAVLYPGMDHLSNCSSLADKEMEVMTYLHNLGKSVEEIATMFNLDPDDLRQLLEAN